MKRKFEQTVIDEVDDYIIVKNIVKNCNNFKYIELHKVIDTEVDYINTFVIRYYFNDKLIIGDDIKDKLYKPNILYQSDNINDAIKMLDKIHNEKL
jgi:hypothetical protein